MPAEIGIYYFSGTGNTRHVASLFEREFRKRAVEANVQRIEDMASGAAPVSGAEGRVLGIGFPVHGFGAPRIVFQFVKQLPSVHGVKVFIFMTAADVFFMNNAASAHVSRCLARKGYDVFHESLIPMPANIAIRYPSSLMKRLCTRAEQEVTRLAQEIMDRRQRRLGGLALVRLIAGGTNACESWGARIFGKDLRVSEDCSLCGKCILECPARNVSRTGDRIHFGWKCLACFRCIYSCPRNAIMPRFERFAVLQDGYDIEEVASGPEPEDGFFTRKTGWVYKRLKKYVETE